MRNSSSVIRNGGVGKRFSRGGSVVQYGVMPRPSVLYVCFDPIPSPKGACTHVTAFVSGLSTQYDVTLMSVGREAAEFAYAGARHLVVAATETNYLDRALAFREAVWDELEHARYDIVHFRTMWAALPVVVEKPRQGFRVVCEVNAVESIELKYHYPALRAAPDVLAKLRTQEEQAFAAADVLITPSGLTKRYLTHRQVPAEKIHVIPNGVDLACFAPAESISTGDTLQVLYLGTLAPWQGVEVLLDALKLLEDGPLHLRIVGQDSSKWRRPLEKRISKLALTERVDILPPVPHEEVPALIAQADICAAPLAPTERNTVQGCHPIKLLEYMACGKPIVASDLPVVRDILTHEESALLCKVDKPARFAEALRRLADDPALRHHLGATAARIAGERFSWARAQEDLLAVYAALNG